MVCREIPLVIYIACRQEDVPRSFKSNLYRIAGIFRKTNFAGF